MALCFLRTDYDERMIGTSSAGVWTGWPPFDVRICKFEMEQWLNACVIVRFVHYRHILAE